MSSAWSTTARQQRHAVPPSLSASNSTTESEPPQLQTCNTTNTSDIPQSHIVDNTHTSDIVIQALETLTDTEFASYVKALPADWSITNPFGQLINKRTLEHSIWGSYKSDLVITDFQTAILNTFPPPSQVTLYPPLITQAIHDNISVWRTHISN